MTHRLKLPAIIGLVALSALFLALLGGVLEPRGFGRLAGPAAVLMIAAFWAAVIAGGLWLASQLGLFAALHEASKDKAISTLRQRYANGEINRAEYFQIKQDLEADN